MTFIEFWDDIVSPLVIEEASYQDAKWGDQRNLPPIMWYTISMEEMGEIAKSLLEEKQCKSHDEIIQTIVCLARMAMSVEGNREMAFGDLK